MAAATRQAKYPHRNHFTEARAASREVQGVAPRHRKRILLQLRHVRGALRLRVPWLQ